MAHPRKRPEFQPYAAPGARLADAPPELGYAARTLRALAFVGNGFLALLPFLFLFAGRRLDAGFYMLSAYCVAVAVGSVMALGFRDRFSFWAGLSVNALGVLCAVALPAALNLAALLLVRRGRGPSDDTVATR